MRKLFLLLFMLINIGFSQEWGNQRLIFGNTFDDTDSLKISVSGMTDSLYSDTLYTKAIPIFRPNGVFGIGAYMSEVSGTSASIGIDVRFGRVYAPQPSLNDWLFDTYTPAPKVVRWGTWNFITSIAKSTDYDISISPSDSTWWKQTYNIMQFRLLEADADTVLHNILYFMDTNIPYVEN